MAKTLFVALALLAVVLTVAVSGRPQDAASAGGDSFASGGDQGGGASASGAAAAGGGEGGSYPPQGGPPPQYPPPQGGDQYPGGPPPPGPPHGGPPPQYPPPQYPGGIGGATSSATATASAGGGIGGGFPGYTPGGGFNPFAWLFPYWTQARPHKGGGIYINNCVACQNYGDAVKDTEHLNDEKACVGFVENVVERPLKPPQLAAKVAELKKTKPNDPTYAILQCCHKVFANKLFGEKEAKTLNFPELEGLENGKTCKDMVHGFLKLIQGDYPKTKAEADALQKKQKVKA